MKSFLKVKIKSLAEEAKIIRREERRCLGAKRWVSAHQGDATEAEALDQEYNGLHRHRTYDVRNEARAAGLAYAFIRGRDYKVVEPAGSRQPPVARVVDLARKYGGRPTLKLETVQTWAGIEP